MATEAELKALKDAIYEANAESNKADAKRRDAETAYATALAETLGVKIGSVVTTSSTSWPSQKQVIRRYRVEKITYKSYGVVPLALIARTIRKDGTDGERHELWQDWKLETEQGKLA
jgi:hypothetical protein